MTTTSQITQLPTIPNTVICPEWANHTIGDTMYKVLTLDEDGWWHDRDSDIRWNDLDRRITGFELLSQPQIVLDEAAAAFEEKLMRVRIEITRSVLDRVRSKRHDFNTLTDWDIDEIAGEFEAEQARIKFYGRDA